MKLLSVMADYQSRNSFPPAPSLPCTVGGCLSFCLAEESGPGYSQEPPLNRLITSLPQLRKGVAARKGWRYQDFLHRIKTLRIRSKDLYIWRRLILRAYY